MVRQNIPFGQKVVSSENQTLFYAYPNSYDRYTLPAGKPSPIIESYIVNQGTGYFQLKGDASGNYYLKDSKQLQIVDPSYEGNTGFLSSLFYSVTDWFSNTDRDLGAVAQNYRQAAKESVSNVGSEFESLGFDLKNILKIVLLIIGGIVALQIFNFLK